MVDQTYDEWSESISQDREASQKASGKKWALLHKFTEAPIKVHFSYPEKPYLHPTSGKHLPFRVGKEHFLPFGGKNGKGVGVECGLDIGKPCIIHAYANPQAYGLQIPAQNLDQSGAKVYYAVAGWIEENYHLVEYYIDERNPSKGTYHRREKCLGKGCEYCQEGLIEVFGSRFWARFSPGQWQHSIHDLNTQIANRYCKCGGTIFVPSFHCGKCNEVILDIALTCDKCHSDNVSISAETGKAECPKCHATWSAFYTDHEKMYEASKEKYRCHCGHNELPVPDRICSTEGCPVEPCSVFDCQLTLHATGAKKERRLIIDDFKIQEPDPRLFDPVFQGNDAAATQIAEKMRKPMDLDYLLRPSSTAEQANDTKLVDPFTLTGRTGGLQQYPRPGQQMEQPQDAGAPEASGEQEVADSDVPY